MPSVENAAGPRSRPLSKRKTATSSGFADACRITARSSLMRLHQFGRQRAHGLDALHLRMQIAAAVSNSSSAEAWSRSRAQHDQPALAARGQKTLDRRSLFGIALVRAALVAGREAHLHLGVDAAGMARIGIEIVGAAAQQKELQSLFGKALGRRARSERPVGPVGFALAGRFVTMMRG